MESFTVTVRIGGKAVTVDVFPNEDGTRVAKYFMPGAYLGEVKIPAGLTNAQITEYVNRSYNSR